MKHIQYIIIYLSFTSFYYQEPVIKAEDYSGIWEYSVVKTPNGDFFGKIFLSRINNSYKGEAINKAGKKYKFDLIKAKGNYLVFHTNLEETDSNVYCRFRGDSLFANVEVKGDKFPYKLTGRKKGKK